MLAGVFMMFILTGAGVRRTAPASSVTRANGGPGWDGFRGRVGRSLLRCLERQAHAQGARGADGPRRRPPDVVPHVEQVLDGDERGRAVGHAPLRAGIEHDEAAQAEEVLIVVELGAGASR